MTPVLEFAVLVVGIVLMAVAVVFIGVAIFISIADYRRRKMVTLMSDDWARQRDREGRG